MRKTLATAVVVGLLATGVGSAGASVRTDDSAVTKDQIKVGITYVDTQALKSRGVNIDHGDYEKSFTAVINDINAKGGVGGRKLVPVFAPVNPTGTEPAQAACVKLTEDEKVFAAIGFFLNDAPLCYLEQHSTPVLGGTMTAEYVARAKAPWYTLEPGDAASTLIVDAMAADGVFKKGKIGVISHAQEQALVDNAVLPALKRNGVKFTSAVIDAPSSDTVAAQAQADTIIQRFKADGITTIVAAGNSIVATGRAIAKTPDYRPRLAATARSTTSAYIADKSNDLSVLKNAVTGTIGYDFNDPALQKCYETVVKVTGQGPIIENPGQGQPSPVTSANTACRYIHLFEALAEATGKNLTTASFGRAAQKAGSVELPGWGSVAYDPKARSFNLPVYLYRFDTATQDLVRDPEPVGANSTGSGTKSS
jgi:ABC-type branched-subunit amino acid transport system substrate-binding protein